MLYPIHSTSYLRITIFWLSWTLHDRLFSFHWKIYCHFCWNTCFIYKNALGNDHNIEIELIEDLIKLCNPVHLLWFLRPINQVYDKVEGQILKQGEFRMALSGFLENLSCNLWMNVFYKEFPVCVARKAHSYPSCFITFSMLISVEHEICAADVTVSTFILLSRAEGELFPANKCQVTILLLLN